MLLTAVPAAAQVAATGLPTREEIDPSRRQQPPATASRLRVEGEIERSPCALADPAYAAIKVTITSATFNNLGPVSPQDIAPAYQRFIGTEQPIAVVCEIRDVAGTILRNMGYLAAVQVPAQRIEGGAVKFEVLYAKLTAIRVRGDAGRSERQLSRYLAHLATGRVFNRFEAERALLLARDMPGIDVRLALKPAGTVAGEMVGEVSVHRIGVEADFNVQNYAPVETGRFGGQARVQFYGLTGLADRTSVSLYSTADFKEQQVLQLGHEFGIGGNGLRLGGHFTYAWTKPTLGPTVPDVLAKSLYANIEASYPFIRTQALTLRGAAGFDYVNQNVEFGARPLSEDRLRVGYVRLDADAVDMRGVGPRGTIGWRLAGTVEIRKGINIFGASPNCLASPGSCGGSVVPPSLVDGDPTATVGRFSGLAELRFLPNMTLATQPRAQVSSAPLFSFESFAAGNYTIGRGYDPGVISGDSGVGFSTELRYDRLGILPEYEIGAQPYAFVDTQWVWNRGSAAGADPQQVSSVGGGARLSWSDRARLDVSLAVPVRDAGPTKSGDVRVLMSLTVRLLPWSVR
ncbi:MAG: ShlB/FhaC/HecB family hemolysin secretion/activation protein [Sandarakinorhabdus sp.]|nr:ShlB/FhaC/HecB family hemolysin secretion/activation protein [Sandarakinorhabdus sp.]